MTCDEGVRWLSEAESLAWRGWIVTTSSIAAAIEHDLRASTGLTFEDYEVMVTLSETDGHQMRMADLADVTVQPASRLSQRIDRLAEKGIVERRRCTEDKRGLFAVLTDQGMACLAAAAPGHVESVRRHLFDHLSAGDVATLAAVMARLAKSRREAEGHRESPLDPGHT